MNGMNEIDVVYVLGKGSIWYNNEIRYSLRSIAKHLKGFRKIWIVGELPTFIRNVNWVQMQDVGHCKEMRIMNKIAQACLNNDITDEFLFINDDHFFLTDTDARTYPFYHKGVLQHNIAERNVNTEYTRSMVNTQNAIAAMHNGNKTFDIINNFDIHTPILYRKDMFLHAMGLFDWSVKDGYIIKTLYCNAMGVQGEYHDDMKISQHLSREDFMDRIYNRHIFSIADMAINDHSIQIFKELYPEKSQWEL